MTITVSQEVHVYIAIAAQLLLLFDVIDLFFRRRSPRYLALWKTNVQDGKFISGCEFPARISDIRGRQFARVFCPRAKNAEALRDINFNAVSVQNLRKGNEPYIFY